MLNIVCCESVVEAQAIFSSIGHVTVIPDMSLSASALKNADALIVRSLRKIDASLLAGSSVKFVATATAGYDHLDVDWLEQLGITWCNAPGCNANSVAEYLVSALLFLHTQYGVELIGKTLGIIGVGAVGSRVAELATALGLKVLLNDPPLAMTDTAFSSTELPTLLSQSDIVSLHVPLTTSDLYPTFQSANADFFTQMKPGAIFINTARGQVANYAALSQAIDSGHLATTILDVWPHEPKVDLALLAKATIATPHIAGHSFTAKVKGTWQAYLSCCEYFNIPSSHNSFTGSTTHRYSLDPANKSRDDREAEPRDDEKQGINDSLQTVWETVKQVYDVERDSRAFKAAPEQFQQLRQHYFKRLEFSDYQLDKKHYPAAVIKILTALGFK